MKEQETQKCEYMITKSGSDRTRCGYPVSTPSEVQWDGYSYTLYLCDSHATRFKAALDLLNHPSQPPRPGHTSDQLDESTRPDPSREEEEDEEDTCDMCGKSIPVGHPMVTISKSIESMQVDPESGRAEIEVVDSQVLLVFCGHCGNRFDTESMVKLARELPPTSE